MQEAIPCRTYFPLTTSSSAAASDSPARDSHDGAQASNTNYMDDQLTYVAKMVKENAVIVFGRRGCCMCHVVKRLLLGLGVNPPVFEVDEDKEDGVIRELSRIFNGDNLQELGGEININGGSMIQFPAVFVGGKLFGGLDRIIATHISGELVPILKDAGALWL